jgi:phospholipid transport system transporter-binding protein
MPPATVAPGGFGRPGAGVIHSFTGSEVLLLPSTVTLAEARDALRMLAQAVPRQPRDELTIDAAQLRRFDTSALAVLLECRRIAQADGRAFAVRNVPRQLTALAALYGVGGLLFEAEAGPSARAADG